MKALAFGEILWDVYGDRKTLGGAPLNVLGHLSRLGASCSAVSAVGDDELGHEALERLDRFRISRRFVRISPYPTGRADVVLMDGKPSYAFNDPSAWDDGKPTMTIQFNYDSNGGSGTRSYFLFDANQEYLQKYRAVISQFSEDSRVTTEIISES